jgi:hypothetical protein
LHDLVEEIGGLIMPVNRTALLIAISLLAPACSMRARLYPVQGPLSAQSPLPVIHAVFSGFVNTGKVSMVSLDGKTRTGQWNRVQEDPHSAQVSSMSADWDAVYGQGYFVSHVLGRWLYARAVIAGDNGETFHLEFIKLDSGRNDAIDPHILGVARDTKGNLYKVVFGPS